MLYNSVLVCPGVNLLSRRINLKVNLIVLYFGS